ncbi:MAG: DNA repair protein RecO [Bacteroidales bacterium]|nr:DNA repair protein RecO [Bacteroidales bacterium]MDD3431787.1 DNA repair protein RecO [Bacteroidales bacterium]MDD4361623.1 DNA repair protein RecO [Bacteroidales bacterium]
MLVRSQALVLHQIPYSDAFSVVHLYTREFGRQPYLLSRNPKNSRLRQSLFQSLSIIEYEADHKGSRELQRLKEARSLFAFTGIPGDPVKNAIALFLSEVLYRALEERESNPALFDFLVQSVEILDLCPAGTANFHLVFLIKLSRYLGFYPNLEDKAPGKYFDLQAGTFCSHRPAHKDWLTPGDAQGFAVLLRINFENMSAFRYDRRQRQRILRQTLDYYRLHLSDFPAIKSLDVLQELF